MCGASSALFESQNCWTWQARYVPDTVVHPVGLTGTSSFVQFNSVNGAQVRLLLCECILVQDRRRELLLKSMYMMSFAGA